MARIRSIHPGLFTDGEYVQLSPDAFMFIVGIWTECDDQGVFEWKPAELRIRLRPGRDGDVVPLLDEMVVLGLVRQFYVDGRGYGACKNFRKWQRPEKPKHRYPLPDDLLSYVGLVGDKVPREVDKSPKYQTPTRGQSPTNSAQAPTIRQRVANQLSKVSAEEGGRREEEGGKSESKHQAAASVSGSHAAALVLRKRLVDIARDAFVTDRAAEDVDPILAVLASGADLDRDVLPVVTVFASRGRTLSTWKPVAMEIEARMKAASASKPVNLDDPEQVDWPLMVANFRKREDLALKQGKVRAPAYAWSVELGPRPDEPGCNAPAAILLEHGYGENAA